MQSMQVQIQPTTRAKPKKKNFLIWFEEATYKQDLEGKAFQES